MQCCQDYYRIPNTYRPLYRAVYLKAIKVLKTRKSEMLSPIISGCLLVEDDNLDFHLKPIVIAHYIGLSTLLESISEWYRVSDGYRPLYRAVYRPD